MIYFGDFSGGVCSSKIGQLLCGAKHVESVRKRLLDSAVSHRPGQGMDKELKSVQTLAFS